MFFRLKKSGQRGYVQIVENRRDGAAVRQKSATPQLRTTLPFQDLGLPKVSPEMPTSRPGFVLATSKLQRERRGI